MVFPTNPPKKPSVSQEEFNTGSAISAPHGPKSNTNTCSFWNIYSFIVAPESHAWEENNGILSWIQVGNVGLPFPHWKERRINDVANNEKNKILFKM